MQLLLLQRLLAKPLAAAQLVAALHGSFIIRYDCSDSLFKEGRQPQGHTVDLEGGKRHASKNSQKCEGPSLAVEDPPTLERLLGV